MRLRRMRIDLLGATLAVATILVGTHVWAAAGDLEVIKQRAASGDAEALFALADRYERGDRLEQDLEIAAQLLQAAAERGHAGAQYRLGLMQAAGVGIDPDPVQGFAWATLAADAEGTTGLLASSLQDILKHDLDPDQVARAEDLVAAFRPVTGPFDLPAPGAEEGLRIDGRALDLPETGCGRLRVAEDAQGPIVITGTVAAGSPMAALVEQALAAKLDRPFDLQLIELAPVLCAVVEGLKSGPAEIDERLALTLRNAEGTQKARFQDEEHLVIELAPQDEARHVYLDYFTHEGEVLHLLPGSDHPDNLVPAGAALIVGDPQQGQQVWQIGPPFGQDLLVALMTGRPLYQGQRPDVEGAETYLAFLRDRMARVAPEDTVRVAYRMVETVPK
jgi:hypothetical protein